MKCVWTFTGQSDAKDIESANLELELDSLVPNQKLMNELAIVYEGADENYYYFHSEGIFSYSDNAVYIYAK